jgi:hypothetical protein
VRLFVVWWWRRMECGVELKNRNAGAWTVLGAVANERILTYVRFRHPLTRGVRSEEGRLSSQAD